MMALNHPSSYLCQVSDRGFDDDKKISKETGKEE